MSDHSEISRLKDASEESHYRRVEIVKEIELQDDVNRICSAIQRSGPLDGPAFIQIMHTLACKAAAAGNDDLCAELTDVADGANI